MAVNFALLGNSRALRADCEEMMRDQASKWNFALDYTGKVEPTESMRRLQISWAWVKRETVTLEAARVGNADVIYDPRRTYPKWVGKRDKIRSTWFGGFYFFRGFAPFK